MQETANNQQTTTNEVLVKETVKVSFLTMRMFSFILVTPLSCFLDKHLWLAAFVDQWHNAWDYE